MPGIEITKNKQGKVVDVDREERNKFLFEELNKWLSAGITVNRTPFDKVAEPEATVLDDLDDDLPF